MTPVYCQECGRANGATAARCLWCGVPISNEYAPRSLEATRLEMDYLGGIDRLDNPAPVRLVIDADGIKVSELMPGSRVVHIPARSILEASVVDASVTEEGKRVRGIKWWLVLGPLAHFVPERKLPDKKKHDYMITIKYRAGAELRHAVFRREDRLGLLLINGLARNISALVRKNAGGSESGHDPGD